MPAPACAAAPRFLARCFRACPASSRAATRSGRGASFRRPCSSTAATATSFAMIAQFAELRGGNVQRMRLSTGFPIRSSCMRRENCAAGLETDHHRCPSRLTKMAPRVHPDAAPQRRRDALCANCLRSLFECAVRGLRIRLEGRARTTAARLPLGTRAQSRRSCPAAQSSSTPARRCCADRTSSCYLACSHDARFPWRSSR